jgi:phosphatidylinositol kinase/protein kinase (PI-3  family)
MVKVISFPVLKEVIVNFLKLGQAAISELRNRFIPNENMKTRDYIKHIDSLIEQSIDNWRTKWYDKYQYWVQGIFY